MSEPRGNILDLRLLEVYDLYEYMLYEKFKQQRIPESKRTPPMIFESTPHGAGSFWRQSINNQTDQIVEKEN